MVIIFVRSSTWQAFKILVKKSETYRLENLRTHGKVLSRHLLNIEGNERWLSTYIIEKPFKRNIRPKGFINDRFS